MQRLNNHAFIQPERTQPVAFRIGHRGPIDAGHTPFLAQRKLVKLHTRYLQPIRNNIKRYVAYMCYFCVKLSSSNAVFTAPDNAAARQTATGWA